MDADPKPKRIVEFGERADEDFVQNHDHTAFHWGWEQAERYSQTLLASAAEAAKEPKRGKRVHGHPYARTVFVKWPKATYGHYIVYREIENGIHVIRILHSRRDLLKRITEAE